MRRHGVRQCVRPSVCPSMGAGRRHRSIAGAAAGECGQCHVVSVYRQLNADLFYLHICFCLYVHL